MKAYANRSLLRMVMGHHVKRITKNLPSKMTVNIKFLCFIWQYGSSKNRNWRVTI